MKSQALHENGTIIDVTKRDLRALRLLRDSGYTHIRVVTWGWETLATAIDSTTPRSCK